MFENIKFKFGSSEGEAPLSLKPSSMVVFVGPNNSGKSLVLREMMDAVQNGTPPQGSKIIDEITPVRLDEADAVELINGRKDDVQSSQLSPGQVHLSSYHPVTGENRAHNLNEAETLRFLCDQSQAYWPHAFSYVYSHYAVALDGKTRLQILDARDANGQLQQPTHVLGRIFVDDVARGRIRKIGSQAFGKHLVVDPTSMRRFEVRLADRPPADSLEEQALNDRARLFHQSAQPLNEASDGVKAYLGLTAAVLCSDHKLMLIDEPEAFLHPPLAGSLGKELASIASSRKGNVFAATHSAHFLMGAIEVGADIDIVRLTHGEGGSSARVLRATDLATMMRDPLLRSTGMLSALFHSAAVVCEGDLDRAAYGEISRRLAEASAPYCKDSLFLSAHGKDAVHRMVAPLRRLGIPAAAVVDLDMVQEGLFGELLKSCGLPEGVWQAKRDVAARVANSCRSGGVRLKEVGVAGAPPDVREALSVLVDELVQWGLFLVPVGELEGWLSNLEISARTKRGWLYSFFERIGSDPRDEQYIRPSGDDIWIFVQAIASWIGMPSHGMPN